MGAELLRFVNTYLDENGLKLSCGANVYMSINNSQFDQATGSGA